MAAEEAFVGAGQTPGLELWRIEAMAPVKQPEANGKFHSGDSYILLATTKSKTSNAMNWSIHFWLGSETSQVRGGARQCLCQLRRSGWPWPAEYFTAVVVALVASQLISHRFDSPFLSPPLLTCPHHNSTPQDESGVAAYKTCELDDSLGGGPIQYREVQGHETDLFMSYVVGPNHYAMHQPTTPHTACQSPHTTHY